MLIKPPAITSVLVLILQTLAFGPDSTHAYTSMVLANENGEFVSSSQAAMSLPATAPEEVDYDTASVRRSNTNVEDSSAIFLRDFLRQASADATTCKAETPLFRLGAWGLHAYPIPYYQEEHGWEVGSMVSLLRGGPIESPYALSMLTTYGEREDRLHQSVALKLSTAEEKPLSLSSTVRADNRHGRRGLTILLGLFRASPGHGTWMSVGVLLGHESYRNIEYLDPSEWESGERSIGGIQFTYDDFGHERPKLLGLQAKINALTAQDILGGDFVNRQLSGDIRFASSRGMVWAACGSIDGGAPIQEHFDLAVVGGIRAGSIRTYQTPSFWASGVEGRVRTPMDLIALPYLSFAGGKGIDENLFEFGIGFSDSPTESVYDPSDWFVRVDFPLYSNAGLETSGRAKWDLRRVMVRVNLPLDLISHQEEIRYRYPNR